MQYDVTALGEILIDFSPAGTDPNGDPLFAQKAGGAPVNLLAAVSRYDGRTAFIGKVGDDLFGKTLRKTLIQCGISDRGLRTDPLRNTTLAFVALDEHGDRKFSFCRNFGADLALTPEEVPEDLIRESKIFHFGSLSLTNEPARSATKHALSLAKAAGCLITYDPNYRPPLWNNVEEAVEQMKKPLPLVDILKISKEELTLLFPGSEGEAVSAILALGVRLVLVTDGGNGARLYTKSLRISRPARNVHPVDTTGAGDIFFGTFLSQLLRRSLSLDSLRKEDAAACLETAISVSGKSTERPGGIASIPDPSEL